jgi:hypothetical protein
VEEKPAANPAGKVRRASRDRQEVRLARVADAKALPERALVVRTVPVRVVPGRVAAESALLRLRNQAEESFPFPAARLSAVQHPA